MAAEKKLLLSVFHNRRWDNGYLTLKQQISKLGKISLYEAFFDRYRPEVNLNKWRENDKPGSGILYDLGAHLIDQAVDLFGLPKAIFADICKQRHNAQTIDYFNLILYYKEMRVTLGSSSLAASPRPVIAAYGDKGSYVKYGLDPQEAMLRENISPLDKLYGLEEDSSKRGTLTTIEESNQQLKNEEIASVCGKYLSYYQQIYKCLVNNDLISIPVIASEGLVVIFLIEAAIKSNESGKIIIFNCNI